MKSAAILAPKKAMNSGSVLVQCPGVVVLDSRTVFTFTTRFNFEFSFFFMSS